MHLIHLLPILLPIFSQTAEAVRLDSLSSECALDPSLPFCDSHILGQSSADIGKKSPDRKSVDEVLGGSPLRQREELVDWLDDVQLDEPDDDDYTEALETSGRTHADVGAYCKKYAVNYHHYCKKEKTAELEGILPTFCRTFAESCMEEVNNPVLKARFKTNGNYKQKAQKELFPKPHEFPSAAVEKATVEVDNRPGKRLFSGSTEEYCKQFLDTFEKICRGGILTTQEDTIDFCKSFDSACQVDISVRAQSSKFSDVKKVPTEEDGPKNPTKDIDQPKKGKTSEGFIREDGDERKEELGSLENLDLEELEELEKIKEKEEKGPSGGMKISEYCDKYIENFNYFCAGEDGSNVHKDFCDSYRKNCPDKVGS